MTSTTTKPDAVQPEAGETAVYLFDDWFDSIEAGLRDRVRGYIETMIRTELDAVLARPRYARRPAASEAGDSADAGVAVHRHVSRTRTLMGTFGSTEIAMPRARRTASIFCTSMYANSERSRTPWRPQRSWKEPSAGARPHSSGPFTGGSGRRQFEGERSSPSK